jgi:cysteine desulfurase
LAEIGSLCREKNIYFHTDAVQGFGRFELNVRDTPVDLFSASSHKIYGPLGAGLLYVRSAVPLQPQMDGGGHEEGRRASTVNVPAIVGFAEAFKIYLSERDAEQTSLAAIKAAFIKQLRVGIKGLWINGDPLHASPHILNVSFDRCDSEILAIQLDRAGIAVSTGSACSSGSVRVTRVLQACGLPQKRLKSAIRFSFGRHTTLEQLETVSSKVAAIVHKVRKIS